MKFLDNLKLLLHAVAFGIAGLVLAYFIYQGDVLSAAAKPAMILYAANGVWIGWGIGCLTLIVQKLSERT